MMTVGGLFSGIGGMEFGLARAGMQIEWMVEIDPFCQKVLAKHWPNVTRHRDVRDFSAWVVGENEGLCYNKVCELNSRERRLYETLNERSKLRRIGELLVSARIAGNKCPFLQALLIGAGDFVPDIVDMSTCEASMAQMQMAGLGCEEKGIPTGKAVLDTSVNNNIVGPKLHNGEDEFSPVINMYARDAGNQRVVVNCEHTILSRGQLRQTKDLISLMESLYAKRATWKCTRRKATIDLICGGVPCQPASVAGKRCGKEDDRWLWPEAIRVVREFRPTWCLFENVPGLLSLGQGAVFDTVLSDLEDQDYTCWTFNIPACAFDAPHIRKRIFVVAYANGSGRGQLLQPEQKSGRKETPHAGSNGKAQPLAHTTGERKTTTKQQRQLRGTQQGSQNVAHTNEPRLAQRQSQQSDTRTQQQAIVGNGDESRNVADTSRQFCDGGDDNGRCRPRPLPKPGDRIEEARPFGGRRAVESDLDMLADGFSPGLVRRGWLPEPPVGRVATGIPDRVAKLKALGNAVVPIVAQWIGERIIECDLDNGKSRAIIGSERSESDGREG